MLQAAELAGNARKSGRHDILIERGKRERQHETAKRQSQLAGRRLHMNCATSRRGRRPGAAGRGAGVGVRHFHNVPLARSDMNIWESGGAPAADETTPLRQQRVVVCESSLA